MNNLVLHPQTQSQIDIFIQQPSHAILLIGHKGSGKRTLAFNAVKTMLGIRNFEDYPYGKVIASVDGKAIGIEAVRELEHFLSLKVPGKREYNRYVIFENAHNLSGEAQNALLKTLEEPPKGTILVLTANDEQALLPTIRSRAQTIHVKKPNRSQIEDHFTAKYEPQLVKQAYAISGGLPGLMSALLADEDHPLSLATQKARQLLGLTTYERLLHADELSKQRQLAINVSFILQQMAHVSLQSATGQAALKWENVLTAGYEADEALSNSAQPKLALTKLMLNL